MDNYFMNKALSLAEIAYKNGDVPVGAVITKDNRIVSTAYNKRELNKSAIAHAEVLAIENACQALGSWRLSDCDLYVTLEPCSMCMGAIINARIKNVYFGAFDKKAGACGSLLNLSDYAFNHHPNIYSGIMEAECSKLISDFFRQLRAK